MRDWGGKSAMPAIRLLMIEDDPDVAELLTTYFDMVNYEVFHAVDGTEGITLARTRLPNLILLDVMLPDINGWKVAERLRGSTLTRYIPIIFLTQRSERTDKLKGLSLGADDYVTKPFDVEELRLRVRRAIERATQDRLYEPRTGLPGGPLIDDEVKRRDGQRGWRLLEVHIEGLSAFRDVYGFMAADEALGFAANAVREAVQAHGTPDDFVGVRDDDHLIVITHSRHPQAFQRTLAERFSTGVRSLYNFRDAERGYLVLSAGADQEERHPLMTVSVGEMH
jgi:CheY-like chemotaxis protein